MEAKAILALVLYALVMSISPGPNNVMLVSSGLIFGMRRTWPHIIGIILGVIIQLVVVGLGLGVVFDVEPRLHIVLKIFGSLYLAFLAAKIWGSKVVKDTEIGRPVRFYQAVIFQFVNPKSWLISVTLVAVFAERDHNYTGSLATVSLVFVFVGFISMVFWTACGFILRKILCNQHHVRLVNRSMAVLVALTVTMFWL